MPNNIIMADAKGGDTLGEALTGRLLTYSNDAATSFDLFEGTEVLHLPNVGNMYGQLFSSTLKTLFVPKSTLYTAGIFSGCTNLETAVFGKTTSNQGPFSGCSKLAIVDILGNTFATAYCFRNCALLKTLILRSNDIVTTAESAANGAFVGTPFTQNGTGGTIYIPQTLYEHLGDGTSLDYKANSRWAAIDGRCPVEWKQIEGSIYETKYADGTPIQAGG